LLLLPYSLIFRRICISQAALFVSLSFFFLTIPRPPRSTPFPTRRSSDLQAHRFRPEVTARADHAFTRKRDGKVHLDRVRVVWHEDRKSTRLNSSHLVISYAVFCLKKKKKTRECSVAQPMFRPCVSRTCAI